jgi:hypothetical protein
MARVWVVYREGLRLVGQVVAHVALEPAVAKLDIAPWRLFTTAPPDEATAKAASVRRRVLVEVREEDRGEFSGFDPGFYESPFSPEEVSRRLAA